MDQGNRWWLPGSMGTHRRFMLRTPREAVSIAVHFSRSPEPPGCLGGRHGIGRVGYDQVCASAKYA